MSARVNRSISTAARTAVAVLEHLEPRRLMFANPTDLDPTFSGDGKLITDFGGADDIAQAVAVQSDGKIVVAGQTQVNVNGQKRTAFAAVRYNRDGSLDDGSATDTTKGDKFATGGKFVSVIGAGGGSGAVAVAIQRDGKIILAGNTTTSAAALNAAQWSLLRLNKDGTPDGRYGVAGVASTAFAAGKDPSRLNAILLQGDGQLLVAGGLNGNWLVGRLN